MSASWICAQLGAREHYAIPRALDQSGQLNLLLTDAWASHGSLWGKLHPNLKGRHHTDLADAKVIAWNASLLAFEIAARARRLSGWSLIMARNRWFQNRVAAALKSLPGSKSNSPVFFAYSYAALEPLRLAKKRGWQTVLGQIDPGPVEERLVEKLNRRSSWAKSNWEPAPKEYWKLWREECALADHIVVNSEWSRAALEEEGIAKEKITIVPLAYDRPVVSSEPMRSYPENFTKENPLRVLFLGQVILRKGVEEILNAVRQLEGSPIEFTIAGPVQLDLPADLRNHPHIHWAGPVSRYETADYYRNAHVFLFPTFSDGFGLTQLEAQAWKLPIIVSRSCGAVVEHGRNGWLLPEVSAEAIAQRLLECLRHPEKLAQASHASGLAPGHTLSAVGAALTQLVST